MTHSNPKLTAQDLAYIQWLKGGISYCDALQINDDEIREQNWKLGYSKKQITNQACEAFMNDLFNDTQIYKYSWNFNSNKSKDYFNIVSITNLLCKHEEAEKTSPYLKLKMLDLLNHQVDLYFHILKFACEQKDREFMMKILKRPLNYEVIQKKNRQYFSSILSYYYGLYLMPNVNEENVEQSFINHIKVSCKEIKETSLIEAFSAIFPRKKLPTLFKAFNINNPELCLNVQNISCSKISVNINSLNISNIQRGDINSICNILEYHDIFPRFFISKVHNTHIDFLVEEHDKYSTKKVIKLFEFITSEHYNLELDEKDQFKHLLNYIQTLNEQFYLDDVLEQSKDKKTVVKI